MVALVVYDTVTEAYPEGASLRVESNTEILHVFIFDSHEEAELARSYWWGYHSGFCKILTVDAFEWSKEELGVNA